MLYLNTGTGPRHHLEPDPHAHDAASHAVWIDLVDPTDEERSLVERSTRLRVPSRAELGEIESSSRLTHVDGVLTLSAPLLSQFGKGGPQVTPMGFVLSRERLLTVRFARSLAFETFEERFAQQDPVERCAVGAFLGLLEALVDRLADVLEHLGGELDKISRSVFRSPEHDPRGPGQLDRALQGILRAIGRIGDMVSNVRDSLLGIARIAAYAADIAAEWIPKELKPRFRTLRQDVASLSDYDSQLLNKVQFLLDATLGFINIQQNNGIKVLTVVSVVGVPPTLVASIYGMNFKSMPELDWHYGYAYGLTMIFLSAVLPLLWFWRKGWL